MADACTHASTQLEVIRVFAETDMCYMKMDTVAKKVRYIMNSNRFLRLFDVSKFKPLIRFVICSSNTRKI